MGTGPACKWLRGADLNHQPLGYEHRDPDEFWFRTLGARYTARHAQPALREIHRERSRHVALSAGSNRTTPAGLRCGLGRKVRRYGKELQMNRVSFRTLRDVQSESRSVSIKADRAAG